MRSIPRSLVAVPIVLTAPAALAIASIASADDASIIGHPVTWEGGAGPNGPFGPGYQLSNFGDGSPAILGPVLVDQDESEFTHWSFVPINVDIGAGTLDIEFVQNLGFSAFAEFNGWVYRFNTLPGRAVVVTSAELVGQHGMTPLVDDVTFQGNAIAVNFSGISASNGATVEIDFTYDIVDLTPGDIDGDGVVDGADLGILLAAWSNG